MRVLKIIFAIIGSLAALLAIATAVMAMVFYTPGASGGALWGSVLYAAIAVACFYACSRIRRQFVQRGFEVVERGEAS